MTDMATILDEFGIDEAWIEENAKQYEGKSEFVPSDPSLPVFRGSHLDTVGKKRITVLFDASDTQRVQNVARNKGVKPSEIYRLAVHQYLDGQELQQA